MLPNVVLHNSTSLDGSLTDFIPNMELHYQIAANFKSNAHLIGSNTIKTGIELYGSSISHEEEKDFDKPQRSKNLPYWVIIDTTGKLKGLLHNCRRFEFCRDIIILLSEVTQKEYIEYLKKRNYTYHIIGKKQINLKDSLEFLHSYYNVKKVLTDTGKILGNLLLEQGLVSKISLLVHPIIVGKESYHLFDRINHKINLRLIRTESFSGGYTWLVYSLRNQLKKL